MKKRTIYALAVLAFFIFACGSAVIYAYAKTGAQRGTNEKAEQEDIKQSTTGVLSPASGGNSGINDTSAAEKRAGKADIERMAPVKARAIYLTANTVGSRDRLNHFINLINNTELNAVVIDIKENGKVCYDTELEGVRNISAFQKYYSLDEVVKLFHKNNIYVIGRLVCFRDPVLAEKRPDMAVKKPDGQLWRENGKQAWLSPFSKDAWEYNIRIAEEVVSKGVDEIQFDYVRFPTARTGDVVYPQGATTKSQAIEEFLKTASDRLSTYKNAQLSADVFGIICESPGDTENIGQVLESVGNSLDYICPMLYPSHYANAATSGVNANGVGQTINGVLFKAPDLEPYKVVFNTLVKAGERLSKVGSFKAKVRPYLQDFSSPYLPKGYYQKYGAKQVTEQIRAVYDAGFEEWIAWSPDNNYSEAAYEK